MRRCDVTFGIGPAGTGKTYLAIAQALSEVLSKKRRKIVLTRPVVEAGENLGFLPGDLAQKISPYLRPALRRHGRLGSSGNSQPDGGEPGDRDRPRWLI